MSYARRVATRRRRHGRTRLGLRWFLALLLIGLSGFYGYRAGTRLAEIEIERLKGELAILTVRTAALAQREAAHRQAFETARARADQAESAYERDVPAGQRKLLYEAVTAKLDDGLSAERLHFVIGAAGKSRDCDPALASKRFIVTTPLQRLGHNNAVSFHNGAIVVTAVGAPATDDRGNPEAWFDPTQEVKVRVEALSGEVEEEAGLLPLQLSLVVGNNEHRLGVRAAPTRGFVQTTLQRCRYP